MRKLGTLTLVAVALLILSQAIGFVFSLGNLVQSPAGNAAALRSGVSFALAAIGIAVGISVCLILFRDPLSRVLFPGEEDISVTLDARSLLFVGIVLIGLNLVIVGFMGMVASLSSALGERAVSRSAGDTVPDIALLSWYQMGTGAVRIALGLGLVWASRPLSALLTRARVQAPDPAPSLAKQCPECGATYDPRDYRPDADARCAECHAVLPRDDA